MARLNLRTLLFLTILSGFGSLSCKAQPCTTYKFSNNKQFSSCSNLPVLNSALHWNYNQSLNRVDIAFRHDGLSDRRWIAWAINPTSGGMVGSQALVAFPRTDGSLAAYTSPITSYRTRLQAGNLSFPAFNVSVMRENNNMTIFASIQLPSNSSAVKHLWQDGPLSGNTPMIHDVTASSPNMKATGSVDFLSGTITTVSGRRGSPKLSVLKFAHVVLNIISWGILMPIGALTARYLRQFQLADPLWFHLHVGCQLLAYFIGITGWATGLFLGAESPGIQYTAHRSIGITLFTLATVQISAGIARPPPDNRWRPNFNRLHFLVGISTIILSVANIFIGFGIFQAMMTWRVVYTFIIIAFLLVTIVLEILNYLGSN